MADLTTSYMGLKLRNPIIVSSSDLTKTPSGIIRCYEAGAGAVVLKSIFEEQFLIEEDTEGEERIIYPEAIRLFAQNRLRIEGRRVRILE